MTFLIIFMVVAIGISFICSIMEAVLLSITPSFIASIGQERPKLAKQAKTLKQQIDRPLAAILTLNTVAHTAGAAGVGAQAAVIFGDAAVGVASAVMTLLVLVFSEIIPKTLGAHYWRSFAGIVCQVLTWLIPLLLPFVWLSEQMTKLLSTKNSEAAYIRAEIEAMAHIGSEQGVIAADESKIITSLLRFNKTPISNILTPRTVLFKVHKDITVQHFLDKDGSEPFSRILCFDKDEDDIIGYVLKNDIMLAYHRLHICLVVDEYGDVQGIVTLEDLIECLLDLNILDECDQTSNMRQKAKNLWKNRLNKNVNLIDGSEPIEPSTSHKKDEAYIDKTR